MRKTFSTPAASTTANDHVVLARISTSSVDRDGEVLLPQGCDASDFLKSPTVFFNHDYSLPVGRCTAIHRLPDRLEAKTLFASRPPDHPGPWLPDTLFALFQQGVLHGFSVGFAPIESRHPTPRDRQTFGDQVRHVYSKWKLLEYSVAPLPANQDALALAVSKGLLTPETATRLFPTFPTYSTPQPAMEPTTLRKTLIILSTRSPQPTLTQQIYRTLRKAQGQFYE